MENAKNPPLGDIASLIAIHRGSDLRRPLFLIHEGSGNLLIYRYLIEHLDMEIPLYGLTPVDQDTYLQQSPKNLIEKLAYKYIGAVRSVQAKGPYNLCGYCMGGLIAFEMAKQLTSAGHEVDNLLIINSAKVPYIVEDDVFMFYSFAKDIGIPVENLGFNFGDMDMRQTIQIVLQNTPGYIGNGAIGRLDNSSGYAHVAKTWRRIEQQEHNNRINIAYQTFMGMSDSYGSMNRKKFGRLFRIYKQSVKAVTEYDQGLYSGDIILLLSRVEVPFSPELLEYMSEFWKNICLGDIKVYDIPGNHHTAMKKQNIINISRIIETELKNN